MPTCVSILAKLIGQNEENLRKLENTLAGGNYPRDIFDAVREGLSKLNRDMEEARTVLERQNAKKRKSVATSEVEPPKKKREKRKKSTVANGAAIDIDEYAKMYITRRKLGVPNHRKFMGGYQNSSNRRTSSAAAYIPNVGYLSSFGRVKRIEYPLLTKEKWIESFGSKEAEERFKDLWSQATCIDVHTECHSDNCSDKVKAVIKTLYDSYGTAINERDWRMIRRIVRHLCARRIHTETPGKLDLIRLIYRWSETDDPETENYWESIEDALVSACKPETDGSEEDNENGEVPLIPITTWLKFERDFMKEALVARIDDYFECVDGQEGDDSVARRLFGLSLTELRKHQKWFRTVVEADFKGGAEDRRKKINRLITDKCTETMHVAMLREWSFLELLRAVVPSEEMIVEILVLCEVIPPLKGIGYTLDEEINRFRNQTNRKDKRKEPWWWCFRDVIERMREDRELRTALIDGGLLKYCTLEDSLKNDERFLKTVDSRRIFPEVERNVNLINDQGEVGSYRELILNTYAIQQGGKNKRKEKRSEEESRPDPRQKKITDTYHVCSSKDDMSSDKTASELDNVGGLVEMILEQSSHDVAEDPNTEQSPHDELSAILKNKTAAELDALDGMVETILRNATNQRATEEPLQEVSEEDVKKLRAELDALEEPYHAAKTPEEPSHAPETLSFPPDVYTGTFDPPMDMDFSAWERNHADDILEAFARGWEQNEISEAEENNLLKDSSN